MPPEDTPVTAPRRPLQRRIEQASTLYQMGVGAWGLASELQRRWRARSTYTLTIDEDDNAYQSVQTWLLTHVPTVNQRALAVHSFYEAGDTRRLEATYDSSRVQRVTIDGHAVEVYTERDEGTPGGYPAPQRLVFRCRSEDAQRAIYAKLRFVTERRLGARLPRLWLLSALGSWQSRADLPPRRLPSVVLPAGQLEALAADLAAFLEREDEYARLGMPWRRGYLLQGPPGTGKTSVVKALASHFNLDLWYVPLGDLGKDMSLINLLNEVQPRSMVLLEDVDIYHAATSREAADGRVSLSGLLNALDGVATPHGLITVLTSNEPKVLDAALVRPGRVDRVEDVGYATTEQARRLFTFFYGAAPRRPWVAGDQTSTAELMEVFKRHLDDPAGAERVLEARG